MLSVAADTADTEAERGRIGSGFCSLLAPVELSHGQSTSSDPTQQELGGFGKVLSTGDQSEMPGKDSDPKAMA